MSLVLFIMEILNQVRMFMLQCLWVSYSKLWMWPEWSSSWRRPLMDFVRVHEHFGSILPKGSKPVDWNNSGLIHVSLYEPKWFVLSLRHRHHLLEQGYSGYQWLSNVIAWAWRRPWKGRWRRKVSWSHIGMGPRNRFAWNEANWTDHMSNKSTWIRWWNCQRKIQSIWIQTIG